MRAVSVPIEPGFKELPRLSFNYRWRISKAVPAYRIVNVDRAG